jgi:hypothetical protein
MMCGSYQCWEVALDWHLHSTWHTRSERHAHRLSKCPALLQQWSEQQTPTNTTQRAHLIPPQEAGEVV